MWSLDGKPPSIEPSDESLLLACRSGDAMAWETLLRRYQRLVYSVPRRAGLGNDLAADVFQQVFAKLVEQVERIEQPARIGAWLVTTARRESWRVSRQEAAPGRLRRAPVSATIRSLTSRTTRRWPKRCWCAWRSSTACGRPWLRWTTAVAPS